MDLYSDIAYKTSRLITTQYSSSFSLSSRLFSKKIRQHIYAIYGMVRIADEIVDTYKGKDAGELLNDLEQSIYKGIVNGYEPNPVLHSFIQTARTYGIQQDIIAPFFASMRMDITPQKYTTTLYNQYIYGSAEVVGLMCLRVFCEGNNSAYNKLAPGAQALGAAYQKVNFLRDLADDYKKLHRIYFPGLTFESFDDDAKRHIETDITKDFKTAHDYLKQLPRSSRMATMVSYGYYSKLLQKIERIPAEDIKRERVRIPNSYKIILLLKVIVREVWRK